MENDKNHKAEEAKPILRWSYELHHRFIDAVNQLGGPNKATPKGLMRILEIPELTLYHLKSHLQKCRLGISQRFVNNKQDAAKSQECQSQEDFGDQLDVIVRKEKDDEPNKNLQIKEATEIQLEDQKKLHEQIERKLQVRIEAQGKYLQSVLMKAQETLFGYRSSNIYGVASMTSRSCLSSEDDEAEEEYDFLGPKKQENRGFEPTSSQLNFSEIRKLQFMEIKPDEVMERKKRMWDDVLCPLRGTIYPGESLWRPRR